MMKEVKVKRGKLRRVKPFPYFMVLPTILVLCVFTFYPFLRSIYLSFFVTTPMGTPGAFVGFKNFTRIYGSPEFLNSLKATLRYAVMVAVGTFTISMCLAMLSIKIVKGCKVYQTMYALPMAIASVPVSALATYIFSYYGIINNIFGLQIQWFDDPTMAPIMTAIVTIWSCVGTSFLYLLVGFRNVPNDLVEASTLDGAGTFRQLMTVYIPLASPQIFFVMFLNILSSFKAFAIIKLLTGKGPGDSTNILVYAVYSNAFVRGRFETACVYSLALVLLIFVVTRVQLLCEKKAVHYQ